MNLKELIKSLTREILDEESSSGDAGGYLSPNAFSPKGQGENAATKTAKKQGFTVTKGETEMPSDSKVRDYKSLWNKKKKRKKIYELGIADVHTEFLVTTKDGKKVKAEYKGIRRDGDYMFDPGINMGGMIFISPDEMDEKVKKLQESGYDQPSQYGAASKYGAASPYSAASKYGAASEYTKNESLIDIVKEELLNEVTYHKFKNEVKFRTKNEQLHKAIREVKRKLSEIDRIVEYTSRMKQELSEGEEGLRYWKKTESNIATISEMVNALNNKIKNLH
jgi:hypothetical protein